MSDTGGRPWRPAASIEALRARSQILAAIRQFFAARGVWEVSTPVLSVAGATDPQIDSFSLQVSGQSRWLQSSPEFHMKRLLAAGSGAIYQINPAFRVDEQGRWHNPEFTMLEWYRPGFDHHQLMDELQTLWVALSGAVDVEISRYRYADLWPRFLGLNWSECDASSLRRALLQSGQDLPMDLDRNGLVDAAMGLVIGPQLGRGQPCFVYDFPVDQAALARLHEGKDGMWASRFEMYWQGIELANGFHELTGASEQRARFTADLAMRETCGKADVVMDEALLSALEHGLPDCAGVALGIDRLCALLQGSETLESVMAFPADRA